MVYTLKYSSIYRVDWTTLRYTKLQHYLIRVSFATHIHFTVHPRALDSSFTPLTPLTPPIPPTPLIHLTPLISFTPLTPPIPLIPLTPLTPPGNSARELSTMLKKKP